MDTYKVSVIVAAYNIEKYIARCLDSILNQTYKNLEIIVVNDGSSDNTGEIIDKYSERDTRIKVIHKENGGVSSARNKGIDMSTGDYIGFVDGDDTIEPDMYELLVSNAINYNCDISHCGYKLIENQEEKLIHGTNQIIIQDRKKGILDLLDGSIVEPGICNKIFKRSIIDDIRLDESVKINEDLLFNVILFNKSSKSVFYDAAKYNYIKREGSATTSSLNNIRKVTDPRNVYKKILEIFKDDEEILPYAKKMDIDRNINLYNILALEDNIDFINLKNEIKDYIKINQEEVKRNNLISKKTRIMMCGILYLPLIYSYIYKIYYCQKYKN